MRYRWKLLIILLIVAIIPPLALRTFLAKHQHRLGDELYRQTLKKGHVKGRLQSVLYILLRDARRIKPVHDDPQVAVVIGRQITISSHFFYCHTYL